MGGIEVLVDRFDVPRQVPFRVVLLRHDVRLLANTSARTLLTQPGAASISRMSDVIAVRAAALGGQEAVAPVSTGRPSSVTGPLSFIKPPCAAVPTANSRKPGHVSRANGPLLHTEVLGEPSRPEVNWKRSRIVLHKILYHRNLWFFTRVSSEVIGVGFEIARSVDIGHSQIPCSNTATGCRSAKDDEAVVEGLRRRSISVQCCCWPGIYGSWSGQKGRPPNEHTYRVPARGASPRRMLLFAPTSQLCGGVSG